MKFVMVFGLFAAFFFEGFNYAKAMEIDEAKPKVTKLFEEFIKIIGEEAKENTNPLLTAFTQRLHPDMEKLKENAEFTFNQYNHYFNNIDYYKSKLYTTKHDELEEAVKNYEKSFEGESDYPLKNCIDRLKKNMKRAESDPVKVADGEKNPKDA